MPQIELLHCADGHLGADNAYLGERAVTRRTEVLRTFERILELCRTRQIPLLLIAGDLFDREEPARELRQAVLEGFASLPQTHIFLAAGNHDPVSAVSPYRGVLPEQVHVFGRDVSYVELQDLPVRVYGASFDHAYCDATQLPVAVPDERLNLLVLHGDVGGSSRYRPLSIPDLARTGMDYVALGHVHAFSGIQLAGNVPYAYAGCFEGQGFDETGEKGVLLGSVQKGRADLEFYPTAGRNHTVLRVDLTGTGSNDEAGSRLLSALQKAGGKDWPRHLYKVIAHGAPSVPIDLDLISARLGESVYFLKIRDELFPALDLKQLESEISLRGFFVKNLRQRMESADSQSLPQLEEALRLGLTAFETEVRYRAD